MWWDCQTSNSTFGCINRSMVSKTKEAVVSLPHQEYCGHCRAPLYRETEANLSVFRTEWWQSSNLSQKGSSHWAREYLQPREFGCLQIFEWLPWERRMPCVLSVTKGWSKEQWVVTPGKGGCNCHQELERPEGEMYNLRMKFTVTGLVQQ